MKKFAILIPIILICIFAIPGKVFASVLPAWKLHPTPTYQAPGLNNEWGSVVWAPDKGIFVAAAVTGAVTTSVDGVNWTTPVNLSNYSLTVTYGAGASNGSGGHGLFVATSMSGVGNQVFTSPDGVTWTPRSTPNGFWLNVTWGDTADNGQGGQGLFVAVGYPGRGDQVMTSPDGINWTGRVAAAARNWNSVTWAASAQNNLGGQGLFVAVAQTGADTDKLVMSSPDGITWTSHEASHQGLWNSVTWSPTASDGHGNQGLFVAVNALGSQSFATMSSHDGSTWTSHSGPFDYWYNVTWAATISNGQGGQGLFVAVGYSNGGAEIMTSPTGFTWTPHTNSDDIGVFGNYVGLAWSPQLGIFVANDFSRNKFMKSAVNDAFTWNTYDAPTTTAGTDSAWNSVIWASSAPNGSPGGHGLFVAVASSSNVTNQVMTSPDGSTWTGRSAATSSLWTSVAWSPSLSLFAAVSSSGTGTRVMTSPDGINWTAQNSAADNNWTSIVWSPEKNLFVAVANSGSGNRVMTSTSGTFWISRTSPADNNWTSVTWSPTASTTGLFVAVANSGTTTRVMASPDGTTWTLKDTTGKDNDWSSIAWSPEKNIFVAVSTSGTSTRVMTSTSGTFWTLQTSAADNNWTSVTWSPTIDNGAGGTGLFVAVGHTDGSYVNPIIGNFVMTSPDGITWTSGNDGLNNWWSSVTWSPELGIFAAVANSGFSFLSTTNVGNWVMTSPSSPNIGAISVTPSDTSATITWTTDELSSSQVNYGPSAGSPNYASSTTLDSTAVTSHSVVVTGLTCLSTYHYQVSSTYAGFNELSFDQTFTTTAGTCPTHPTVTISTSTSITATSVTFNGNITATGQSNSTVRGFKYGLTSSYGATTTESGSFGVSSFTASTTGLTCNTTYHMQAYATNINGTGVSSPDKVFTTSACPAATQTWTGEITGIGSLTDATWQAVTWSPELNLFVATAANSAGKRVMTSPDGITWTVRASAADISWVGVTWSPTANGTGLFAAVSTNGTGNGIMTSPDGITWTTRIPPSDNSWRSVVWSPKWNMFIAVATTGTNNRVMKSTDGITWTAVDTTGMNVDFTWSTVIWAASAPDSLGGSGTGLFVAVGSGTAGTSTHVMTSPDGINWTMRSTGVANISWFSVAWSPEESKFVAVASACSNFCAMTSSDGITWDATHTTSPAGNNNYRSVVWSSTTVDPDTGLTGLFVASSGAGTSNRVMTSHDGVTWAGRATASNQFFGLTWAASAPNGSGGHGLFVAAAQTGTNLFSTSPDGVNWTTTTSTFIVDNQWQSVAWSTEKSRFVAVANTGTSNRVMWSPNGKNWTAGNTTGLDYSWQSVVWSPTATTGGLFVAVGSTSGITKHVMISSDGLSWSGCTAAADNSWTSITWGPTASTTGLFVAVANTGSSTRVMTSSDGCNWSTQSTTGKDNNWTSVTWSPELGMFAAVSSSGSGNRVMTSTSGTIWDLQTSANDYNWTSVTWSPEQGLFVAVANTGSGNRVMTSSTGTGVWSAQTSAADNGWTSVAWSPLTGVFTAVSSSAATNFVMTSTVGVNWTLQTESNKNQWTSVAWSPTLGIFASVAQTGYPNVMISGPAVPYSVSATTTATNATITWTTDQGSTSKVNYGNDSSYGSSTTLDSSLVTSHSVLITGLTCGSHVYHYQVVSAIGSVSSTSTDSTFTTLGCASIPTVTSSAADSITTTSATLHGNLTATGGENASAEGFHWGTDSSYGTTLSVTATGTYGVGTFSANLTGLTCSNTYHYEAFATNSGGTGRSTPDIIFTTLACPISAPTVTASSASSITSTTATLNGNITATGGASSTSRGFNWGTTSNYGTQTTESGSFGISSFTTNLTNLTCNQTYHYQAYATNSAGTATSTPDKTFVTGSCPIVTTSSGSGGSPHPNFSQTSSTSTDEFIPDIISTSSIIYFKNILKKGNISPDVKRLQQFLNTHGFVISFTGPGSKGYETNTFGAKTFNALIKFQEKNAKDILTPIGLKRGTGFFGLMTLKFINGALIKGK